jgi:uncharacterized membrane protein YesL
MPKGYQKLSVDDTSTKKEKKGWKTRLANFLERNRFFVDMILASGFDVVNITLFANLTTAQLAAKFMLGLGARVLFPIAMTIMGLELFWSWTKVGLERRFGRQSRFATLAHAVMMTFLVPLIIFLFIKESLLLPYFFVAAFASMTMELFILAAHSARQAYKAGYGFRKFFELEKEALSDTEEDKLGMSPKAYFKQALTLAAFALVNTALTVVIAFVMVVLGPLVAPVAAAVGAGFSVAGAAIRAFAVRNTYKDKQKAVKINTVEIQYVGKNLTDSNAKGVQVKYNISGTVFDDLSVQKSQDTQAKQRETKKTTTLC